MNSLNKHVKEMRNMAKMLVPHTHPKVSFEDEQQVLCMKQKVLCVDGYRVTLCLSRADYGKYILDSLQIQSYHAPFLPFHVICKIGKVFFGTLALSYIEFFRSNRKVYCWAIKHKDGRLLSPGKKTIPGEFEGFEFRILSPGSVDLF